MHTYRHSHDNGVQQSFHSILNMLIWRKINKPSNIKYNYYWWGSIRASGPIVGEAIGCISSNNMKYWWQPSPPLRRRSSLHDDKLFMRAGASLTIGAVARAVLHPWRGGPQCPWRRACPRMNDQRCLTCQIWYNGQYLPTPHPCPPPLFFPRL